MLHALSLLTRLSHLIPSSSLCVHTARSPLFSLGAPSLHIPPLPFSLLHHFSLIFRLSPSSLLEYPLWLHPLRHSSHSIPLFVSLTAVRPSLLRCPSLSSLVSPPLPTLSHSPLTPSDFLHPPSRPRRVPFAPSLIYCITVHEVANLRRVILYKYVSQINIRATTICIRASRRLQGVVVVTIVVVVVVVDRLCLPCV